ncbi:uncharacterized protein LOC126686306 [Mercurialis annua]|uniref:uncharacterized protein LOC126686306 n=1 Tax=Mercurialis annua TaxID=3986 RepID=UPI00215E9729|nr:uncharacterized protein LOC126686306 [Mercurialis annua]XP_050236303.1 uncharacterized protein LOC126686306 [Mercurialis annua]
MLSIDKSPPADPSSSSQSPQFNSTNSDEPAVDLPKFSIRDYVFTARSKDIKKNWPFSLENLQLCLKHGVKDVLPPFQLLDSVKTQSFKRCTVDKEKTSNSFDDPQLKIDESCIDIISSCRSGEENDFPSTTTSVSQSEIESSEKKQSSLPAEARRKTTVAVEAAGNNKTESVSRPVGKKCRLIVKFGCNSDRNSGEDIASNSTTVSETMASKVCPVCKTFSSSSNTTLNAHIDQCLSVESPPKWAADDSKLTRHRIKPRKTRLMVDIYCTAKPCTLEELDRRNGTSWATITSLPARENERTESGNEGKRQKVSTNHPEDVGDVGPVYIDANGTKLRILSKFDDQPSGSEVRRSLKEYKEMKKKKKKKHLAQKHQKYLELASQSKKFFSHNTLGSQNSGGEDERPEEEKSYEKHLMSKQLKSNDSGTLRPWVCSKQRGFSKKTASQEGHQPVRCNWHLPRDLLVEDSRPYLGDSLAERTHVKKFTNISSSGNNERTEKLIRKIQISDKREQLPGNKLMGDRFVEDRTSKNPESSSPSMKQNSNRLGRCDTSANDTGMLRPLNSTRNHASLLRKKTISVREDSINGSGISCIASSKSSRSAHAIVSKAMKFSSFRRNISVNNQSSRDESMPIKIKKWSALKKPRVRSMKKRNEEVVNWHSEVDKQHEMMLNDADSRVERNKVAEMDSLKRSTVPETRQARRLSCFRQEKEGSALRSSKSATQCYDDEIRVSADSIGDDDGFRLTTECLDSSRKHTHVYMDERFVEPSSRNCDNRRAASLIKSVDSEFYNLSNSLKVQSNYRGLLCGNDVPAGPSESDFISDQEMFSADEVGHDLAGQNVEIEVDLDAETGQGNSFPEVDPIPIPGPPGSFLPSPRDMGSEDFQGNSSLTTSRVHSSPDHHDVVDGDSSDSPMSAASTISNPSAGRSEFKYSEPSSSFGPYAVQDSRSAFASAEPSLQNAGFVPESIGAEMERTSFDGDYLKLDRIYIEKGSVNFKNDKPCCCQRKERFNHGVTLNYEESQLLRRRRMTSVPANGKQTDFNCNLMPVEMDVRSELAPPSNCPNSGSENSLPVIKPLASSILFKDSPNGVGRLLARSESDAASPSASNPILRLMGKNLMVVNNDEDASVPFGGRTVQSNNQQTSKFPDFSRNSPDNIQNPDSHPLHHMCPQPPVVFGQNSHTAGGQCFDGGLLSNSYRTQSDSRRLPVHVRLPAGMFHDQRADFGFATAMDCHDYNVSSRHNMEKVVATPDRRHFQLSASSLSPVKEIFIIDNIPESENNVLRDVAKYSESRRESSHPYTCYQPQERSPMGESPFRAASFHATTPTELGSTCPIRWSSMSESSSVSQQSPFTAPSSSPNHRRSALHYSPGFS